MMLAVALRKCSCEVALIIYPKLNLSLRAALAAKVERHLSAYDNSIGDDLGYAKGWCSMRRSWVRQYIRGRGSYKAELIRNSWRRVLTVGFDIEFFVARHHFPLKGLVPRDYLGKLIRKKWRSLLKNVQKRRNKVLIRNKILN